MRCRVTRLAWITPNIRQESLTQLSENFMFLKYSITAGAILLAASQSASAVTINFDYSHDGGFFSGTNTSRQSFLTTQATF